MDARIGVCSWSLQPRSAEELVELVRSVELSCVQLALNPLRTQEWPLERAQRALAGGAVTVRSGMMAMKGEDYSTLASIRETGGVRPDATWEENRRAASENARIAQTLGLSLVTFHAGFLPEGPRSAEREKLIERLRELVDRFADRGVEVAFETGQERAATLLGFLEELDRPRAGVNFDPANMVLYDMGDPVAALEELAPWVRQIHVKDARRTSRKGTWGEETAAGAGEVDWEDFFDLVCEKRIDVDLMIERESGSDRPGDIRAAREFVRAKLAARGALR